MSIMVPKPSAPPKVEPTVAVIQPKAAHSVLVDNKEISRDSLITHISGIALVCDYFALVVNKDNALYSQDVGQSGSTQQYSRYNNFEFRQKGSLNDDQDDTDKVFVVRGTGVVHSGLIPNEGDMFTADVGDGRRGVFNVTRSQRLSIFSDSVYQIEYSLMYFVTDKPNDYKDLEKKVVKTMYYVKDRLDYNDSPFLADDEYNFYRRLGGFYHEISRNYFAWFFSKEFAAYVIPGQTSPTFDYFLYKALRVIFREDPHQVLVKHQAINIMDDDLIERGFDLFSVLLERSASKFEICDRRAGLVRTESFSYEGTTTNIRYTGIRYLVYPVTTEARTDEGYNRLNHTVWETQLYPTPNKTDPEILLKELAAFSFGDKIVPLIKPVTIDDYYILSEDFYKRGDDLSVLEAQTLLYIDGKPCEATSIRLLCENYRYWPRLEKFYYLPILLILIQSMLKDI